MSAEKILKKLNEKVTHGDYRSLFHTLGTSLFAAQQAADEFGSALEELESELPELRKKWESGAFDVEGIDTASYLGSVSKARKELNKAIKFADRIEEDLRKLGEDPA